MTLAQMAVGTALTLGGGSGVLSDDLSLDALTLDWVGTDATDVDARGAITSLQLEQTMEGASTVTVTVRDAEGVLLSDDRLWQPVTPKAQRAPTFTTRPSPRGRAMGVELDGVAYRLVKVSKAGDDITLTFENRGVYWLRRKTGSKHQSRNDVTRAQFILSLLRELDPKHRIRLVCPELNVRQPIDKGDKSPVRPTTAKGRKSPAAGGIPKDAKLTVKGRQATAEQRRIGSQVLRIADENNATPRATLAVMEAVIVESEIRNLTGGLGSAVGVLQVEDRKDATLAQRMTVSWAVSYFLHRGFTGRGGAIGLAKRHPDMSPGQIAQRVQGSGFPDRYDKVRAEAAQWLAAYGGGSTAEADAAGETTYYKSYQFQRGKDEDSWTAIQRLAGEVGWRAFMVGNSLYYMSEQDLFRRAAVYTVKRDDPAVLALDYDVDWGKRASELHLQVVLGKWNVPVGSVVKLEGYGPASGRWLVVSWSRDYFSPLVDVTLRQPGREKLEPAPETGTQSGGLDDDVGVGDTGLAASTAVMKVYRRVEAIDRKGFHYVYGGGHGSFNDPRGYDCSGFVSSCLHAAGLLKTPQATPGLLHWGQPGEGKYMTVWVHETGAGHTSHTFMTFNLQGRVRYAEAGGSEKGRTGWHRERSHAGFVPRHWPGT